MELEFITRCKNYKHSLHITTGGYLWCRKPPMHTVNPEGYCDGAIPKEKENNEA